MVCDVTADGTSIFEVGVDYITATARTDDHRQAFHAIGKQLCAEEEKQGSAVRPWRFSGYRGLTADGVSWGVRPEDTIIRLSSNLASEFWTMVFPNSDNVSRLDVQVTVKEVAPVTKVLQSIRRSTHRGKPGRGRPSKYHFHVERAGPTAITIGSRASDVYLRAYDKGVESGLEYYANTLRYEAELKGRQARHVAAELAASSHPETWIAAYICRIFSTKTHRRPYPDRYQHLISAPPRPLSRRDSLRWHLIHLEGLIEKRIAGSSRPALEALLDSIREYQKSVISSP